MRIHSQKGVFMNWIKNERFLRYNGNKAVVLAFIEMDTIDDMPAADEYPGKLISKGSIVHDISAGDRYCLNSSSEWVKQKTGEGSLSSFITIGSSAGSGVLGNLELLEV